MVLCASRLSHRSILTLIRHVQTDLTELVFERVEVGSLRHAMEEKVIWTRYVIYINNLHKPYHA